MRWLYLVGLLISCITIVACIVRDIVRSRIIKRILAENDRFIAEMKRRAEANEAELAAFIADPFDPRWSEPKHPWIH